VPDIPAVAFVFIIRLTSVLTCHKLELMAQFRPEYVMTNEGVLHVVKAYTETKHVVEKGVIIKEILSKEHRDIGIKFVKASPEFTVLRRFIAEEFEADAKRGRISKTH
jgi:hypothetical protein